MDLHLSYKQLVFLCGFAQEFKRINFADLMTFPIAVELYAWK